MKKQDNGLLLVYTGNGKGKTTAALGMCVRAVGYDWNICIIQFVKGTWEYGELKGLKKLGSNVELNVIGQGFVGIIDDNKQFSEHCQAASDGLRLASEKISSGDFQLVILDELNVAMDLKLIEKQQVEELLKKRPETLNVVITGRGAPDWLIEKADLVTEMREIKHPFQAGIPARKGIDW